MNAKFRAIAGFVVLVLLTSPVWAGRPPVEIVNHENVPISASKTLTLEEVRQAIISAGKNFGYPWLPVSDEPGKLKLRTVVRGKHVVEVLVTYDATAFSIVYADSVNLNYQNQDGVDLIHPNYNGWVRTLMHSIAMQLKTL